GLRFEELKGSQPLGADVRDAAAFLCWSLPRAYDAPALAPHAPALAEALLRTALFDRQLSVRRAAAAALQEACGRLADAVPHAIELSTTVDFVGVGPRHDAYTALAPRVAAQLERYRAALLDEAWLRTRHWDSAIRVLAAHCLER